MYPSTPNLFKLLNEIQCSIVLRPDPECPIYGIGTRYDEGTRVISLYSRDTGRIVRVGVVTQEECWSFGIQCGPGLRVGFRV